MLSAGAGAGAGEGAVPKRDVELKPVVFPPVEVEVPPPRLPSMLPKPKEEEAGAAVLEEADDTFAPLLPVNGVVVGGVTGLGAAAAVVEGADPGIWNGFGARVGMGGNAAVPPPPPPLLAGGTVVMSADLFPAVTAASFKLVMEGCLKRDPEAAGAGADVGAGALAAALPAV